MHLFIDFLTLVNIAANVRKLRFDFGVGKLQEWAMPEHTLLGLEAQIRQRPIVLSSHLAVDLQEAG